MFTRSSGQIQVRTFFSHYSIHIHNFSDPNICNIFHVCTTRNDKVIDQPFLCPYPTIFKTTSSGKMFCAYPTNASDCQGKAFYYPMENSTRLEKNASTEDHESINYRLPKNTLMVGECTKEGLYPDNIYCNAYHECDSRGQEAQYLCENQLLFNPESNICDYPINVVCGGEKYLFDKMCFIRVNFRKRFTSSTIGFCQWYTNKLFYDHGLWH